MYKFSASILRIILTILSVVLLTVVLEITLEIASAESLNELLDLGLDLFMEYLDSTLILVLLFQLIKKKIRFKKRLITYLLHAILLTVIAIAEITLEVIGDLEKGEKISFWYIIDFFSSYREIVFPLILIAFLIPPVDHFFSKQTVGPNLEGTSENKGQRKSIRTVLKLLFRNCLKLFFGGIALLLVYGLSIVSIYMFLGLFNFESLPSYAIYIIVIIFIYLAFLIISLTMRILVRTFPLRANGQWRRGVIISFTILIGAVTLYFGYVLTHPLTMVPVLSEVTSALPIFVSIFFITYLGITIILPMLWLIIIHARCKMRKGILYLRKFNGKGDIAIMAAILRKSPGRTPVTFIASPGWNAGTWDPIVLMFAGFKWYRPWSNVPLFLKTRDNTWQSDVKYWITNSRAIVIDISDLSNSVKMETGFIDERNARNKTIALKNERSGQPQSSDKITFETTSYVLSWSSAFPRILLGFLFILILAADITSTIQVGANFLDIKVFIPVFISLLPILLLFLRPSLPSSSENSIKIGLRRILNN